ESGEEKTESRKQKGPSRTGQSGNVLQDVEGRGESGQSLLTSAATGEVRRVRPYHLGCIGNQWCLFGYDLMRGDIRKFVPGRMRGLRVLEASFERPKDFSVDKYLKGSFGVYSGGELVEVRIWFDRA